jgi:hypothetical protein
MSTTDNITHVTTAPNPNRSSTEHHAMHTTMHTGATHPAGTTPPPAAITSGPSGAPTVPTRRGWAAAGWVAGLLGLAVFIGPASALSVPRAAMADNDLLVEHLRGQQGWIWAYQTSTVALALLLVVFGLGLRRRLAGQAPTGSILPDVAGAGMLLVSAMLLVGGGISTEMFHSVRNIDEIDPDTLGAHLALYNTMGWVWVGGALTTTAVAIAGLRHGSVSKALARFGVAMTVLVGLTQITPLQYLAVLPVTLFVLVCGVAQHREIRRSTASVGDLTTARRSADRTDDRYHLD